MRSTPELVAANYALDLMAATELVAFAREALWNDLSSPSLDLLALLQPVEFRDAGDLFVAALEELGIAIPSRPEAVMRLARAIATEMVRGETSPYDGTAEIAGLSYLVFHHGYPLELQPFVYAEDEWDERPEDADFFVGLVMPAARDLADPC